MLTEPLHPTEHRGYRELYASLTQLSRHWQRLGARLAGSRVGAELVVGASEASELLEALTELTERRGPPGRPLAAGLGAAIAGARNVVGDRMLERNQAVRLALLDVHHGRDLLGYLARAAERRGDVEAAAFCRGARERLGTVKDDLRAAHVAMAGEPDLAIRPAEGSFAGRLASSAGVALGALGELIDRRAGGRR